MLILAQMGVPPAAPTRQRRASSGGRLAGRLPPTQRVASQGQAGPRRQAPGRRRRPGALGRQTSGTVVMRWLQPSGTRGGASMLKGESAEG